MASTRTPIIYKSYKQREEEQEIREKLNRFREHQRVPLTKSERQIVIQSIREGLTMKQIDLRLKASLQHTPPLRSVIESGTRDRVRSIDDLLDEAVLDSKPWEVIVRQHSQSLPTTPIRRPTVRVAQNRYSSVPQRLERRPIEKRNVLISITLSILAGSAYYASTLNSLSQISFTLGLSSMLMIGSFVLAGLAVVALASWAYNNRNRLFGIETRYRRQSTNPFDTPTNRSVL